LISDGRYSGVTYGAAIGHVTPEALNGGGIGLLQTGDLLHLQLSKRRIDLIDPQVFLGRFTGRLAPHRTVRHIVSWEVDLHGLRSELGAARRQRILERRRRVAATNRLHDVTDASKGVVPLMIAEEAVQEYEMP
jgi:dihydroxyacid dehydratase/phosphogluconate dehydratase